jgi:hypothetical protein
LIKEAAMSTASAPERTTSGTYGFAGILAIMLGAFNIIEGFFALVNDKYVGLANGQFYVFDRTGWGWIHMILGVILLIVGFGILSAKTWARVFGIIFAVTAALIQMIYLPIYPFWALINIALLVYVIYALTTSPRTTALG